MPVENLVGEENRGWTIAKYLLGNERTNIAGIGMCKRLLRRVKELAAHETRRGRPLLEDPRFREKLARLEIQVLSHEWSLMRMISLEQAGRDVEHRSVDAQDPRLGDPAGPRRAADGMRGSVRDAVFTRVAGRRA